LYKCATSVIRIEANLTNIIATFALLDTVGFGESTLPFTTWHLYPPQQHPRYLFVMSHLYQYLRYLFVLDYAPYRLFALELSTSCGEGNGNGGDGIGEGSIFGATNGGTGKTSSLSQGLAQFCFWLFLQEVKAKMTNRIDTTRVATFLFSLSFTFCHQSVYFLVFNNSIFCAFCKF
jgi:hypothetical protein